jgi:NAD(P)H-flavin reductase
MKQRLSCKLKKNTPVNNEIFRLDFAWSGTTPRAGQFFMVKPKRSSVFLGRPLGVALWNSNTVEFLVAKRGKGTGELVELHPGEEAELLGPLGNAWADFLPDNNSLQQSKPLALIGGGVGIAPLKALAYELPMDSFDFYAGLKTGFRNNKEEKYSLLGPAVLGAANLSIAVENGRGGLKGRIPDFLSPADYSAVCACGPEAMLRVTAEKCVAAGVPCYVSLERRMACGVGACLGCNVNTSKGNRRCCADGPIFPAEELMW